MTTTIAPFTTFASRAVLLPQDDIDTDQIIPARFLKTTNKDGLAANLFADWRYETDGAPRATFPLNDPQAEGARILIAARNFGCGSSREHAVWALASWGIRAVIALSFADIFQNNALKNGLVPVTVDPDLYSALIAARSRHPSVVITIDLAAQRVSLPDGTSGGFPIDAFAKQCLLKGVDELGYLLTFMDRIEAHESQYT
jgi:3-isopropylmalate/(R)-2-methylmalate dehydratase small subunit